MRIEVSTDIARSPEEVFAFLAKHSNHARFVKENESSEQVSPGPMAVGAKVRNTARFLGRPMVESFVITEFDPPRTLAKASEKGSTFETTDRFDLSPLDSGRRTRVVLVVTAEGIFAAIVRPMLQRSFRQALARLKEILESQSAG